MLVGVDNNTVKYVATFICTVAVYNGTSLNLAWLNVNVAPQYRRATAIGIQQTIGNTAGAVAGQVYRKAPYVLGNSFSLGAICVAQCLITAHMLWLRNQNKIKERVVSGEQAETRKRTTGDRDINFVYRI